VRKHFLVALCLAVVHSGGRAEIRNPQSATPDHDTGLIRSQRLVSGVPLGGIGCGTFEILTDGTIAHATINNNWDRPTGDLKGCFAAVWTNAGGRVTARALKLRSEYGLPAVAALDYRGLFPQAHLEYPDPALPINVSLRAHSFLVPHDLKNSSLPAALFVFTLKNESRGPVEAAVALSWENFLGVGGNTATGEFADRTGNAVTPIPSTEGIFGLRFSSPLQPALAPPDRLRYNALGTYALLVQPTVPDAQITLAEWNVLDAAPGWWASFAKEGTVVGTLGAGKEGSVHPAGVLAVKVALKDKESREVPFVVAWHTPRHYTLSGTEYGHLYQKSFEDAVEVGRYALENRLSLAALTDEWQNLLLRSTLPSWLIHRLINDASVLFTNTVLTRDSGLAMSEPGPSLFAMLESPTDGGGALGAMDHRFLAQALLSAWFPALDLQELRQFKALQASSGAVSRLDGNVDQGIGDPKNADADYGRTDAPDAACGYVFQVFRAFRWIGEQTFLDEFYPSAKHAIEFVATLDRDGDSLPEGPSVYETASPQSARFYRAGLWLAALRMARQMAAVMNDRRFEAQCAEWFENARKGALTLWNQNTEGRTVIPSSGLAGQWMADTVGAGDLLPPETLREMLDSLMERNDKAAPFGPPLDVDPDGLLPEGRRCWLLHAVAYQAALYTLRGHVDTGLALMQKIDRMIVEQARSPWNISLLFRADTGQPAGMRRHIAAPASWFCFYALLGLALDLPQARLTLAPHLPTGWKTLSAPLFAPGFWAWMDYRPGPARTRLTFRLDRFIPTGGTVAQAIAAVTTPQEGAGLVLRQVVLPDTGEAPPQVMASLGRAPVPGKATRLAPGRLLYTFDSPIKMTAGQRLEFTLLRGTVLGERSALK